MRRRRLTHRLAAGFLALAVFTAAAVPAYAETGTPQEAPSADAASAEGTASAGGGYKAYLSAHAGDARPQAEKTVQAADFDAPTLQDEDGRTGAVLDGDTRSVSLTFMVPEAGVYNLALDYYGLTGKGKDIVFGLLIDGKAPFAEAETVSLSRTFEDAGEIEQDTQGNDLRPSQQEVFGWNSRRLMNTDGYFDDPYGFYFTAGEHTVTFTYFQESMLIGAVTLAPVQTPESYAEYSDGAEDAPAYIRVVEAEDSYRKSSSMLYPTYDRSSAATSPSHYSKIRYNTIGQSNWALQGQWISWEIEVPADGWYTLSFKVRQNVQQGINSYRTLYIDGEMPFAEVKNIAFPYRLGWYMQTLGDGETPYRFYLTEGRHELTLEVCAGPMGEVLKDLNDAVLSLNGIYRSIIMITGTTPDRYRTFYLMDDIPGLEEELTAAKALLDSLYDRIIEITGTGGSQASTIREMSVMLSDFLDKPLDIPTRISQFKTNLESLGSLILTFSSQPLELDYIVVSSQEELPSVGAGFWEELKYGVQGFFASFVEDYNSIGGSADGQTEIHSTIDVWISSGRDQSQILKSLIDNDFTPNTGIDVRLSIVSTAANTSASTLVQATLAGKGPDVALFTPKDTPVNLAMRGALAELSSLDGFADIYGNFHESAWIPYIYEGGVYAVPETQNFDMLFYRTDVFAELGLTPPETWEEFYAAVEVLQKNNLGVGVLETSTANAGVSSGIGFFDKMLLQRGGTYYTEDLTQTAFDTQAAYDAFEEWTQLYTEYGLDRTFDFYSRFRTGDMPMGIMTYTMYNQLYAAAPEIRGLWAMTLVPGTRQEDGSILRTETAAGTGAVMLQGGDRKAAWEFLKWWAGDDVQTAYGTELEASLGVLARYDAANITAFNNLGWGDEEKAALSAQWEEVTDIMQIPGNYFISRCLTNAFRAVVDQEYNPVRALNTYNKDMNAEIERKRQEFHLDG